MRFLKLYEDFGFDGGVDEDYLMELVKKQAIRFNNKEIMDFAVSQGFDLEKHKKKLLEYCYSNGLYDNTVVVDIEKYQRIKKTTMIIQISEWKTDTLKIKTLTELEDILCDNNTLTSLNVETNNKLKRLYLHDSDLKTIDGLGNLTKLEILNCGNNKMENLDGLGNLTSLTELHCDHNYLTSLKGIENLTNLTVLRCHNNKFSPELRTFEYDISKWQEYYRNN